MNRQRLLSGAFATAPLAVACIPWGVLAGTLAIQAGFTPIQAQALSLFVFAGAVQLSTCSMFATSPWSAMFGSAFVISSRHLLYSLVFRAHLAEKSIAWRLVIGFLLTDETFAVSEAHTRETGRFSASFALGSGLCFYVVWNLASLLGIFLGSQIIGLEELGLEFAIVATFIAMTFTEIKHVPVLVAITVAALIAFFTITPFPDAYIVLAALAGMVSAYLTAVLLKLES